MAGNDWQALLRGVVHCIGLLISSLRDANEESLWPQVSKAFSAICNLCVDGRPKVRKQAATSVTEVGSKTQISVATSLNALAPSLLDVNCIL